jgi:ComF family protein
LLAPLARRAASFLFPSRCLACSAAPVERLGRGGVCDACWCGLPELAAPRCAGCDEALPGAESDARCGRCLLDPPAFEALRAAAPYAGSARRILLAFKFRGADYLAGHLAGAMAARLPAPDADEVVAVPATARSRRERGYHPAALLAASVARRLGVPHRSGRLRKVRETERQSLLPAARRPANVRRAFAVAGTPAPRVLLVDDVATSGATARECAARLRDAGAERVVVWCFARASRTDPIDPEAAP